jgi:hypothetical protein
MWLQEGIRLGLWKLVPMPLFRVNPTFQLPLEKEYAKWLDLPIEGFTLDEFLEIVDTNINTATCAFINDEIMVVRDHQLNW